MCPSPASWCTGLPASTCAGGIPPLQQICSLCPVRAECLADALHRREPHGVWGGLTTNERHAVLRAQDAARGHVPADFLDMTKDRQTSTRLAVHDEVITRSPY